MHVLRNDDDHTIVDESDPVSLQSRLEQEPPVNSFASQVTSLFRRRSKSKKFPKDAETADGFDVDERRNSIPIAQHYNPDRSLIYDEVKSSRESNFTVAVEQVSIFLTSDGTVISFFQVLDQWYSNSY
jgi:hypothetical protein